MAQRKMNHPARPTKNMRMMSAMIVQSIGKPFLTGLQDKIGYIHEKRNGSQYPVNPVSLSGLFVSFHYHLSLSEFITTVKELIVIATAATIGFKSPAMASGTAATL